MSEKCENLEACGFFLNYQGNSEVIKNGWVRMYCEDLTKSERCERKKIKKKTGSPPVDSMSPTGEVLL